MSQPATRPARDQRVVLHVGVPSAGTALVASSLLRNRKALRDAGVLHPGTKDRMRLAAVDVLGSHRASGLARRDVRGCWDDLARRARAHPGTTVVGHELLAAASPRQVAAAMTMLRGLDVHVVVTARDPARQVVAEWLDQLRSGSTASLDEFRSRTLDGTRQDLPGVLERWAAGLPRDRVHVVTCPPTGSPTSLVWQRFADVVGFDPTVHRPAGPGGAQAALGAAEVDLLRRVALASRGRVGPQLLDGYARGLLRLDVPAPGVPAAAHDDLVVVAERWAKDLDRAGYRVHGHLDDLLPTRTPAPAPAVDVVAQLDTAVTATAQLLVDLQQAQEDLAALRVSPRTRWSGGRTATGTRPRSG
jgi:hypothetical protein